MANRLQKVMKASAPRRRRVGRFFAVLAALAAAALLLWMQLCAFTVKVRFADVYLEDLPSSFDGTKLMHVTDVDLCGIHTAAQTKKLFSGLQAYSPDILLLGGDYVSPTLFQRLNGTDSGSAGGRQADFFRSLSEFHAPLGKFAVSGDNDGPGDKLRLSMTGSGVELLDDTAWIVSNGQEAFAIAGIGAAAQNVSALASRFHSDQCVIALMHSPQQSVPVRIAEAGNGGSWADLLLTGHTHGGQIVVAGRSVLSLTEAEQNHLSGWYRDDAAPMLVNQGLGCEGVNLRLGTTGEVWLITLHCK